jgi:peptidoglycan/LPS O-acetylase OafA/YrhL
MSHSQAHPRSLAAGVMLDCRKPSRPAPHHTALATPTYRPDIDGLRAIAVVSVVLFHAGFTMFSGGYVGVDIFFVISGYLIAQMIARDLQAGEFSVWHFYERRIRRIFPALFVMLAVCTLACAFIFLPDDFRRFGRNSVATALFSSNIGFWLKTGYFDGETYDQPLIHTWSLAVEEQFYILFPLFLASIWWLGLRNVRFLLASAAGISFLATVAVMQYDAAAAFYLTPFRAWELLSGSLLALGVFPRLTKRWQCEMATAAGLLLITIAALSYSDVTSFPGVAALLPCVGAALVIHGGSDASCSLTRLISTKPFVGVGLISYSLYLWHWPLIVLVGYLAINELSSLQSAALVAVSFMMALISWRYIELPARAARRLPVLAGGALAIVAVAITGAVIYFDNGWPTRFSKDVNVLSSYALSANPEADECANVSLQLAANSPCTIGSSANARIFLWGDSHAGAMFGAMSDLAAHGASTVYGATPRCPPLLGVGTDRDCIRGNDLRLRYALSRPELKTVIIAARWSLYLEGRAIELGPAERNGNLPQLQDRDGVQFDRFSTEARHAFETSLRRTVGRLLQAGKKVVIVYPVPEVGYDVPSTAARLVAQGHDLSSFNMPEGLYRERQQIAFGILNRLGRHVGLIRIYPTQALCPHNRCVAMMDGKPLYFDSHHLSIPGSMTLVPLLARALRQGV